MRQAVAREQCGAMPGPQTGGTPRLAGGQEVRLLQQRGGAWLRSGGRRTDTHGGVEQAFSLTIPGRQIGRWQWQDFIEVGKAAIGVEAEGVTKCQDPLDYKHA